MNRLDKPTSILLFSAMVSAPCSSALAEDPYYPHYAGTTNANNTYNSGGSDDKTLSGTGSVTSAISNAAGSWSASLTFGPSLNPSTSATSTSSSNVVYDTGGYQVATLGSANASGFLTYTVQVRCPTCTSGGSIATVPIHISTYGQAVSSGNGVSGSQAYAAFQFALFGTPGNFVPGGTNFYFGATSDWGAPAASFTVNNSYLAGVNTTFNVDMWSNVQTASSRDSSGLPSNNFDSSASAFVNPVSFALSDDLVATGLYTIEMNPVSN